MSVRPDGKGKEGKTKRKGERPLNILFTTPECAPWVKTGGLGDVCGALPKALTALGHDVRVLIPAFPAFEALMPQAQSIVRLPAEGPWPEARLLLVREKGLTLWLLDCPKLYDRPSGPYVDQGGKDFADNAERFGFLSRVAAKLSGAASPADWHVDVLHAHDWTTSLAPAYLCREARPRAASVVTIHNLLFQGMFPSHLAERLDLPPAWLSVEEGLLHWDRLCFLKAGLRFADRITTVSPTYAREIQREPEGCGLDGMLRLRAKDLTGILNGIDTQAWHPAIDALIPATYDADSLPRKAINKQALQLRMGLKADPGVMLLGLVSRLTPQKGIDLVVRAMPDLIAMGVQVCVVGSGDRELEQALQALAVDHPGQVAVHIGFDEPLAHLVEAGADAFLMPSTFEPCGLNQMYSQAYGTPPIVHAVGGLADSVSDDVDPAPDARPAKQSKPSKPSGHADDGKKEVGTGYVFHAPTTEAFLGAVRRALEAYRDAARWQRVQRSAMALDHSWDLSAKCYEEVYRAALSNSERASRT